MSLWRWVSRRGVLLSGGQFKIYRSYSSSPLLLPTLSAPMDLMSGLTQRIANLEHQLRQLSEQQQRLQNIQTLLRMSETFKALHKILFKYASLGEGQGRRMRRMLSRYRLGEEDLMRTMDICRLRNEAAHPTEMPDLTEVDPEIVNIFVKVEKLLKEVEKRSSSS